MRKKYVKRTNEELLDDLNTVAKELGRRPRISDFKNRTGYADAEVYRLRFESFTNALVLAGVASKEEVLTHISKEKLIEDYRTLAFLSKKIPKGKDVKAAFDKYSIEMACANTYIKRFGSWRNVFVAAKFTLEEMAPLKKRGCYSLFTDENLIQFLQYYYTETGSRPKVEDLQGDERYPHPSQYIRRFGSFKKALEIAGLAK